MSILGASLYRRILLIFLLGVLLPVLGAAWLSHRVASGILRAQALAAQERLLEDLSRGLWTLQESSSRQVAALSAAPVVVAAAAGQATVPEELFRTFLRLNPEWTELILFDSLGRVVWASDAAGPYLEEDELFELFFSGVSSLRRFHTPVTEQEGARTTRMVVKVLDRESLVGVLAATLDLGFLSPFLARTRVADDLRVALWDDRGLVFGSNLSGAELALLQDRLDRGWRAGGRAPSPQEPRHQVVRLEEGSYLVSIQGVPRPITTLEPMPGESWFMAVAVPQGRVFASLRRFQLSLWGAVLLSLIGCGTFLAWLGRGVSSPLERMAGFAERIAAGERRERLEEERDDEVGRLARALDDMAASLSGYERELVRQEGLAIMGRMSALVAHELRSPLNAMKGSVQLLQIRLPGEPLLQEQAGLLLDRIHHLARFVEELLQTARLPPPRIERVSLGEVVAAAWEPLREQAAEARVDLRVAGAGVPLAVDREQLVELVHNLARNALEAIAETRAPGVFEVCGEDRGRDLLVIFQDDGPGISAEVAESLFYPFATTKRGGTGLGLVVCRMAAENHGGTLEAVPGDRGACFQLVLPGEESR